MSVIFIQLLNNFVTSLLTLKKVQHPKKQKKVVFNGVLNLSILMVLMTWLDNARVSMNKGKLIITLSFRRAHVSNAT